MEKVGEIAVSARDHKHIKLPGVRAQFRGFDRNPYLASFRAGAFEFLLVNVHLFFGKDDRPDRERRSLEAYATSRWGDLRRHDKDAYLPSRAIARYGGRRPAQHHRAWRFQPAQGRARRPGLPGPPPPRPQNPATLHPHRLQHLDRPNLWTAPRHAAEGLRPEIQRDARTELDLRARAILQLAPPGVAPRGKRI